MTSRSLAITGSCAIKHNTSSWEIFIAMSLVKLKIMLVLDTPQLIVCEDIFQKTGAFYGTKYHTNRKEKDEKYKCEYISKQKVAYIKKASAE